MGVHLCVYVCVGEWVGSFHRRGAAFGLLVKVVAVVAVVAPAAGAAAGRRLRLVWGAEQPWPRKCAVARSHPRPHSI
jgi:hypothetical protein